MRSYIDKEPEKGLVVKIISQNHKYYGHEAVIRYETPKKYYVRIIGATRPLHDRFIEFRNGKLNGTKGSEILMFINKDLVKLTNKKTNMKSSHDCDACNLLTKYKDMTKSQIETKIGEKIIGSRIY
jgi:hypothetical protein